MEKVGTVEVEKRREFGVGNAADAKAFATVHVGSKLVELFFGEHPHSYSDNSIYARFPGGPIYDFSGHRFLTKVVIEERNYIKQSDISGDEIRKGGRVSLFINDNKVAEEFTREWEYGLDIAKDLFRKIMNHPMDLWEDPEIVRQRIEGRKVYYDNTPAVLRHWMPEQACVMVDAVPGMTFPMPAYAIEDSAEVEYEERTSLKVEVFSERIWWHRNRLWPGE